MPYSPCIADFMQWKGTLFVILVTENINGIMNKDRDSVILVTVNKHYIKNKEPEPRTN